MECVNAELEELKARNTPMIVEHSDWVGVDGVPYDLCPRCKTNLCTSGFMTDKKKPYCADCGQALNWEEHETEEAWREKLRTFYREKYGAGE